MPNYPKQLDRIFYALSDPTRREVLSRLSDGPAPASELAQPFDMALPSFMQHLGVLEDCGLVHSQKKGRVRTYRITPEPLQEAEKWLTQQRQFWEKRLDQLDDYLIQLKNEQNADITNKSQSKRNKT